MCSEKERGGGGGCLTPIPALVASTHWNLPQIILSTLLILKGATSVSRPTKNGVELHLGRGRELTVVSMAGIARNTLVRGSPAV